MPVACAPTVRPLRSQSSDGELMLRLQAGDRDAFAALVARFGARAHRVARGIRGADHCEDVVQEAFFSVWQSCGRYQAHRGTVASWILGIVRLRAIDAVRSSARHDRRRDDRSSLESVTDPFDIEQTVEERDHAARLRGALAALPIAQRDAIVLAYYGELSGAEIASELALPLGTVKGRIRIGLEKLRQPDRMSAGRPISCW